MQNQDRINRQSTTTKQTTYNVQTQWTNCLQFSASACLRLATLQFLIALLGFIILHVHNLLLVGLAVYLLVLFPMLSHRVRVWIERANGRANVAERERDRETEFLFYFWSECLFYSWLVNQFQMNGIDYSFNWRWTAAHTMGDVHKREPPKTFAQSIHTTQNAFCKNGMEILLDLNWN